VVSESDDDSLTDIDCSGADESDVNIEEDEGQVTIDLAEGEDVTCTFFNDEDDEDDDEDENALPPVVIVPAAPPPVIQAAPAPAPATASVEDVAAVEGAEAEGGGEVFVPAAPAAPSAAEAPAAAPTEVAVVPPPALPAPLAEVQQAIRLPRAGSGGPYEDLDVGDVSESWLLPGLAVLGIGLGIFGLTFWWKSSKDGSD
jgi:hypothetical protein